LRLGVLIAIEKEQLVFPDRAAERSAERIPYQRGARSARCVAEEVIGLKLGAAIKLERRAVPGIRSRLGNQVNLRARGAALIGVSVCSCDAKFFDRFGVESQNRTRGDTAGEGPDD